MLGEWVDPRTDEPVVFEMPYVEMVCEEDEPRVLYGPDGGVLVEVRRPFGFAP